MPEQRHKGPVTHPRLAHPEPTSLLSKRVAGIQGQSVLTRAASDRISEEGREARAPAGSLFTNEQIKLQDTE